MYSIYICIYIICYIHDVYNMYIPIYICVRSTWVYICKCVHIYALPCLSLNTKTMAVTSSLSVRIQWDVTHNARKMASK